MGLVGLRIVVSFDNQYNKPLCLYRGKKCVQKFLIRMMQEKKYIYKIIQQNRNYQILTKDDKINYKNAKICHIYEKELDNDKVKDHCHITGKYRGAVHDN